MATASQARAGEDGIVRRLVALMRQAKELGLNFTVVRAMAETEYRKQTTPEKPETVLREFVATFRGEHDVVGQMALAEWRSRMQACLDGLPPQLNLVDRGARGPRLLTAKQEAARQNAARPAVADGTQGMRRGE